MMRNITSFFILCLCCAKIYSQDQLGSYTDSRDNITYKTVTIGNQVWMAENLRYYQNECTCYNNDTLNCTKYGRFYSFKVACDVCPIGWHLPSTLEWNVLIENLGGKSKAGGKMKTIHDWKAPNVGANNSSGFSALPAGYHDLQMNEYFQLGVDATFWTSSIDTLNKPSYVTIFNDDPEIIIITPYKDYGFNVRCIKDNRKKD